MSLSAGNKNAPYAESLELGDARIRPRPYLKKAIDDQEKEIFNYFVDYLEDTLGKI